MRISDRTQRPPSARRVTDDVPFMALMREAKGMGYCNYLEGKDLTPRQRSKAGLRAGQVVDSSSKEEQAEDEEEDDDGVPEIVEIPNSDDEGAMAVAALGAAAAAAVGAPASPPSQLEARGTNSYISGETAPNGGLLTICVFCLHLAAGARWGTSRPARQKIWNAPSPAVRRPGSRP